MSIRAKLIVMLIIIFTGMMLLLYYSFYTIRQLHNATNEIVSNQYQKVETANVLRNEVRNISKVLRDYLLSDSQPLHEQQIAQITQSVNVGSKALLDLEKMTGDEQGMIIINHLKTAGADYLTFQQDILKKITTGDGTEAARMLTQDTQKYQQTLFQLIDDLVNVNTLTMQKSVTQSGLIYHRAVWYLLIASILVVIFGILVTYLVTKQITSGLAKVADIMEGFSKGSYGFGTRLKVTSTDEIGVVSAAFNKMADSLDLQSAHEKEWSLKLEENVWLHSNLTKLFTAIQEIDDMQEAAKGILSEIMPQIGASFGVIYIKMGGDDATQLERMASYASIDAELMVQKQTISFGEGLIGQCALEQRIIEISEMPPEYFQIQSALGTMTPRYILIMPLLLGTKVKGVMEIASHHKLTPIQLEFLTEMSTLMAIHVNKIKNKLQIEKLLEQSNIVTKELQEQSKELFSQQEELAQMNAELEEHAAALEESDQQMQIQQADLENMNEELREKSIKLEEQNQLYQTQNSELEKIALNLDLKRQELTDAISYKSIFLANMSHELRTPLNSMLILTKLLADNKERNLTPKQVEYASTVYSSGRDLLQLINEILELAKVESKKVDVRSEVIELETIIEFAKRNFEPIAEEKAIPFSLEIDKDTPQSFYSDQQRLLQILQNLLSNAFKFTEQGSVILSISMNKQGKPVSQHATRQTIEFSVIDTGIGIEADKQQVIFDAFVQADGTTSRKYGGTGLGLSISREFAALLGGEIKLQSTYGQGSTFTFILPVDIGVVEIISPPQLPEPIQIPTPRSKPQKLDDRKILLVDDDIRNIFALSSGLESYGLTVLNAESGREALDILDTHGDIDAILMDIMMPDMDGYETMQKIRSIPKYRDLPILAVTAKAMRDDREKCIQAGASDYITKPIEVDKLVSLLKVWLYA
jgi:two-component system chemotaxis sensor kinase CheA